ncbi:MAG: outer membrane beta-barrel protein [Saprospiraceae bacterium]
MKNYLLTILLSLPLFVFAQHRASFELHISPSYTNFTAQTSNLTKVKGKVGYDFGLNLSLPTNNERLVWLAGLQLSSYGTKHKVDDLRWGTQHDGNGGYDPNAQSGESITGFKSRYNHYFLQIPLGVRYYLSQAKTRFFIQPTLAPNVYLTSQTKSTVIYAGQPNSSESSWGGYPGTRKANLFASLGIGLEIPINNKIGVQIQPHGGIQVLAMAKDSATGARLYSAGLDVALRYSFF